MSTSPEADPARFPRRGRLADNGGFTLIEVLVAFVVMATLLSVLFRGVVTMRAGSAAFDAHTREDLVARAVLDDALAKRDLANGTYSGVREGLRWTIVAKAIDLSGQLPPPKPTKGADASVAPPPPGQPAQSEPGQAQLGQPAPPNGAPGALHKDDKPAWKPQRLLVRIATAGRPLEIETIRLVKAEARR